MKTLVRFTRSHADDDEIVEGKGHGALIGENFFAQLVEELAEPGFSLPLALVKFENDPMADGDTYFIYATVDGAPPQADLVPMLQHCYDDGAAGFFEVILEGL